MLRAKDKPYFQEDCASGENIRSSKQQHAEIINQLVGPHNSSSAFMGTLVSTSKSCN